MKPKCDETLEEIWAIRRLIAQEFGFDPRKQVAHYQRKQKQLGASIYRPEVLVPGGNPIHALLHDDGPGEPATVQWAAPTSYSADRKPKGKRAK